MVVSLGWLGVIVSLGLVICGIGSGMPGSLWFDGVVGA